MNSGVSLMNEQEANILHLTPVGEVQSNIKTPILIANDSDIELQEQKEKMRQHQEEISNSVSEVLIYPQWTDLLDGIEGFSHILVLYWPHLIGSEGRNLKRIHPMGRKDLPVKGIFSTCSPARPNPVLVSAVPLLERKGNILKVKGLEAVDQSPVIDIKPYVKTYYWVENLSVPEWMIMIHKELGID